MRLFRRLCAWLAPSPPVSPADADAAEVARVEGIQSETARVLRGSLHARTADRKIREAREELARQKARVAVLDMRAAVRGREES